MSFYTPQAFKSQDPNRAIMLANAWRLFAAACAANHQHVKFIIDVDSQYGDDPPVHDDWVLIIGDRTFIDGREIFKPVNSANYEAVHWMERVTIEPPSAGLMFADALVAI